MRVRFSVLYALGCSCSNVIRIHFACDGLLCQSVLFFDMASRRHLEHAEYVRSTRIWNRPLLCSTKYLSIQLRNVKPLRTSVETASGRVALSFRFKSRCDKGTTNLTSMPR